MRGTQYFLLGSVSRLGVIGFLVMGGFVGQGLLAGELGLYEVYLGAELGGLFQAALVSWWSLLLAVLHPLSLLALVHFPV